MELVVPSINELESYLAALHRGFAPGTVRPQEAIARELAAIEADPISFLALKTDFDAVGPDIVAADGSTFKRLPSLTRWLWDGEFAGAINIRWQPGTDDLPTQVLGHIGYAVVEWRRGRGYASLALEAMLPTAREVGLTSVELTTDFDNLASQKVIRNNGGVLEFVGLPPARFGTKPIHRYRIRLDGEQI